QAQADPVGIPRGHARRPARSPLCLSRQETDLPVHDLFDQPAAQVGRGLGISTRGARPLTALTLPLTANPVAHVWLGEGTDERSKRLRARLLDGGRAQ